LPHSFKARIEVEGLERTIGDYIAGMTDRFAMQEWERFQQTKPPLAAIKP
jgi:dGTP triphosphohydrolase